MQMPNYFVMFSLPGVWSEIADAALFSARCFYHCGVWPNSADTQLFTVISYSVLCGRRALTHSYTVNFYQCEVW
jgi:hypothetical protein